MTILSTHNKSLVNVYIFLPVCGLLLIVMVDQSISSTDRHKSCHKNFDLTPGCWKHLNDPLKHSQSPCDKEHLKKPNVLWIDALVKHDTNGYKKK